AVLKVMKYDKEQFSFLFRIGRFPFQTDAFRGHGLSLLDEQARLRGPHLMHLPLRFRCRKHLLFPLESPSSTSINHNFVMSKTEL
ncbi:MAG: hypothetical protein WBB47_04875, partial [Paenisporosarcina sp.]